MTTLEIILIAYLCISQILAMVILNTSSKPYRKIKIIGFFILNPLGIITIMIISYIQDRKGENEWKKTYKGFC